MVSSFVKHGVKLVVDGLVLGGIQELEYNRDIKEMPEKDGFRQYAPGDNVTCDVTLHRPAWRWHYILLSPDDLICASDEWYSPFLGKWHSLKFLENKVGTKAGSDVFRRKALVLG